MTTPDAEDERLVDEFQNFDVNTGPRADVKARLLAHFSRQRAEIAALRASLEASSRKAEGLREALRKYGMHAQGCSSWQRYHKAEEACSCGLTSALASTGDAKQ